MKRALLVILAGVLAVTPLAAVGTAGAQNPNALDAAKWKEDLAVLREQMPRIHGNLFHSMTREQFHDAIDALEKKLPQLTSNQVKAEIMRLVAMVHDGHTRVRPETLGNHMLPVRLHFFADGLYVEAADNPYANIVGGKVERIGAMSAEDAYASVRPLVQVDKDNEYRRKLLAPDLLVTPEVLQAIGATKSSETVELTVEKDHREITIPLPAGPFRARNNHGWPADPKGWVNARTSAGKPVPLWLQHTGRNYWHQFLADQRTLYIQYNQVQDEPGGEPISRYFPALFKEAAEKNVDRVILDLRLNGGGNNELNRPIWHAIIKNERLNQKGRLWVIIGPQTFSAAMNFVDDLEMNTNALFVGEPTGETPNMWGDPVDLKLPNSGIVIQASTLWWQFEDPRDDRPYRAPDLAAAMTFADYAGNIDPAMEAIEGSHPQ
ncbi:MAG TPA: hypothetical protein VGN16_08340 [Acidobacteriaceae bacterium]|jgi:hypothetical protein